MNITPGISNRKNLSSPVKRVNIMEKIMNITPLIKDKSTVIGVRTMITPIFLIAFIMRQLSFF